MDEPVCPLCGDDTNVQKVSGIYREQSSQGPFHESSELARLLRPPAPQLRHYWDAGSGGHPLGWVLGYGVAAVVAIPMFRDPFLGWLFGLLIVGFGGTILGLVGAIIIGTIDENGAKRAAEEEQQSPQFRRKVERWELAYYCRKHDVVFLPGQSLTYPPTDLHRLLSD